MLGLALSLAMTAQAGAAEIDPASTPSKSLAAPRASAPSDNLCDEPVLMVIAGYSEVAPGTLAQFGGYRLTSAAASDVLGTPGAVQAVLRFPCRNNALSFWKTLAPAPGTSAAIYPQLALPEGMVGKVGDDSYSAAFDRKR